MTTTLPPALPEGSGGDEVAVDPAALRTRLAEAETRLTQTEAALAEARLTAAQHATKRASTEATVNGGAGAPESGHQGGAGTGGKDVGFLPATGGTTGTGDPPTGEAGGTRGFVLPTAGRTPADYEAAADGDGGNSEGSHDWRALPPASRLGKHPSVGAAYYDDVLHSDSYNDGFDAAVTPKAHEWLQSFDIPRAIIRPEGLPVPFTPQDGVHGATFVHGSRDEMEARRWYCTLAWTQSLYNEALEAHYSSDITTIKLMELTEFFFCALRRLHALGVSRYDYLGLRQSEPALAEAFAHADAVPRNTLRGDGARRYLSRVARQ